MAGRDERATMTQLPSEWVDVTKILVAVKRVGLVNHTMLLTFLIRTPTWEDALEKVQQPEKVAVGRFRITKPFRFYRGSPNVPSSGPPATRRRASGARSDETQSTTCGFHTVHAGVSRSTRAFRGGA